MKTIFIIAPQFPPSAQPPSQRARLYVKHMSSLGFHPVVFTVDHHYREEIADPWMVELAGNKFELLKVNCLDQRKTRRFGIGDLGLRMLPFLYRSLSKESGKRKPDFILYLVPPWYIMIIAPFLKRATGVKYGIDFIDPWVHGTSKKGFKARMSQWIARNLEGAVLKRSDLIVAVSKGILADIKKRHAFANPKPMLVLPYGVEVNDYAAVAPAGQAGPSPVLIRYIGAISDAMLPVVNVMIQALEHLSRRVDIKVEFTGTSYAARGLARARLTGYIQDAGAADFIKESPDRVAYREAIRLNTESDILLLIGDTTHYYAASKLMGLIASGKPFVAFVHEKSFPASFLAAQHYPYVLTYADGDQGPGSVKDKLVSLLAAVNQGRQKFTPLDIHTPAFEEHTAYGMTQKLTESINNVINASQSS